MLLPAAPWARLLPKALYVDPFTLRIRGIDIQHTQKAYIEQINADNASPIPSWYNPKAGCGPPTGPVRDCELCKRCRIGVLTRSVRKYFAAITPNPLKPQTTRPSFVIMFLLTDYLFLM